MESLSIQDAGGGDGIEFFGRSPFDPSVAIDSFWTKLTDTNLSAEALVFAGYAYHHPARFFRELAESWKGRAGERTWQSLEGELTLRSTQDRAGHVSIRVELNNGLSDECWSVCATVMTEAGQLEGIAKRAALFFGEPSSMEATGG